MELITKFQKIIDHKENLLEKYHSIGTTIAQLTAAGCINATEYWKDGKYLYLLRPMNNGKRVKTYVGNHSLRIEEARQKVINHKRRFTLIAKQERILDEVVQIESCSNDLYNIYLKTNMGNEL